VPVHKQDKAAAAVERAQVAVAAGGGGALVADAGVGHDEVPTGFLQAEAEVSILQVEEKAFVKEANLAERGGSQQQAGPGEEFQGFGGGAMEAHPTEPWPDVAASPGLDARGGIVIDDDGPGGAGPGIRLQPRHQGCEAAGIRKGIVVDQPYIGDLLIQCFAQGRIVGSAETGVGRQHQEPDFRESGSQLIQRPVRGAVVHHDNFAGGVCEGPKSAQQPRGIVGRIPIDGDGEDARRGFAGQFGAHPVKV